MASRFGNPLFPQFNALVGAPLAASTGIVDDKWFAATLVETLLFPFVFTIFPMRVHEVPLANPLCPVVYALFVARIATLALRRRALGAASRSWPFCCCSPRSPAARRCSRSLSVAT